MNKKFSLIHTGGPYGDETSTYDGYLNQPLTVREFINAVFEQYPNEWGEIQVYPRPYTLRLEYSHKEIVYISSQFNDCLDRKIKSFSSCGGWSRMDYTLILEDK